MTPPSSGSSPPRWVAAFATGFTLLTGIGAAPASAHTVLVSSDLPADATLATGPARVSATFNEDLQPTFAAMTVVGPDGNLWTSGAPEACTGRLPPSRCVRSVRPAGTP